MRSITLSFLFIWLSCLASSAAWAEEEFLSPEEAFAFIHLEDADGVTLQWQIADGYYLYQHRTQLKLDGKAVAINNFPPAKPKFDEYFGEIGAYYHFLNIPIQVGNAKQIEISYQGCADAGLCYPPQTSVVQLGAVSAPTNNSSTPPSADSFDLNANDFALLNLLKEGSTLSKLALFFLIGVVTAFAGCSYPMFPILSKIIVGQGQTITRPRAFGLSLAYVLPIAVVYALLGVIAGYFGSNLSNWFQTPLALSVVAFILVAMALSMLGLYELQMPSALQSKLNNISGQQKSGTYSGAIIMGILSAFIVSACTVPPIVAAITYIAQTGDILLGASAMFLFGLGLGAPLLALGLSASWLLPKAGAWMDTVQKIMGIFLLSAAVYILSRFLAETIVTGLWIALLLGSSFWLLLQNNSRFLRSLSAFAFIGLGLMLAQISLLNNAESSGDKVSFNIVSQPSELSQAISNSELPVLIDYYADWCTSCIKMEKQVYPRPEIKAKLDQFTRLKIDLTEMTPAKEAIMQSHGVVGPPAILFLNNQGKELREQRITGEVSAQAFDEILKTVLTQP